MRCGVSEMARADALARLAWAYGVHLARRRLRRPSSQLTDLLETYAPDGIRAMDAMMRERERSLTSCISCGMCAFAATRLGQIRPPDLASSYMRLYARLDDAASDLVGEGSDLAAASAVCPVGVPLEEVANTVRRLSR